METAQIKPGVVVTGSLFPEPVRVLAVESLGTAIKLIGQGLNTNMVRQPILQYCCLESKNDFNYLSRLSLSSMFEEE